MEYGKIGRKLRRILCALVPSKGFRDAVREGYVREYLAFKRRLKREGEPEKFPTYLSACAIVKNEAAYIAEWIEYHLLVGVEKFYIYDNESTDDTKTVLAPYVRDGIADHKSWPGTGQQSAAYNDALAKHRATDRWIAFIDLDEFLVPISKPTIPEILREYEDLPAVCVNWLFYGDNGFDKKTDGLVIERFTAHSRPEFERNRMFKSIVNPRRAIRMLTHNARFAGPFITRNTKRQMEIHGLRGMWRKPAYDKMRLNHYWGKSKEEFRMKKARGDVVSGERRPDWDESYEYYNRNEIKDDRTMEKYVARVKENISKRFARNKRPRP
ncbi:MAG: glycosyltransferase family 92 protein [Rickettsiales bacterium]|jgi:hypothetical protein|nr:glycosyltransferase family 92 protein [Rickettsiales bacterium]